MTRSKAIAAIRIRFTHGPISHADELVCIGGYPDLSSRDRELVRLRTLGGQAPITPWVFEPCTGDRASADLWADAHRVSAATGDLVEPESLLRHPNRILELLSDPTDGQRGWYSVDEGGVWVDVRDLMDQAVGGEVARRDPGRRIDFVAGR